MDPSFYLVYNCNVRLINITRTIDYHRLRSITVDNFAIFDILVDSKSTMALLYINVVCGGYRL